VFGRENRVTLDRNFAVEYLLVCTERMIMNVTPTAPPIRSQVIRLAEAQGRIPGPAGEHAIRILQRGTLDVALSIPERPIQQSPHEQDELYVIIRGGGVLFHDGKRDRFEPGDFLFVAAGIDHQFEDITEDLAVWRIFYGSRGGEVPDGRSCCSL
jgi:mannose-6-phosphate isomerase-like protein (cupin superfamily)